MTTIHWTLLIPAGIFLIAGVFLAADVDVSRAENSSTFKMRMMILCFGLACLYISGLLWYFDIGSWRLRPEHRWMSKVFFLICGALLVLTAALRSRIGLIKDSEYFTKSTHDIEIGGGPEVTPAERVERARRAGGDPEGDGKPV